MHTDGHSMWASVQKEPPPREPDYSSIEQLFCLPVTEHKDKGAAAPVKKEPKEVCLVNTRHSSSELYHSRQMQLILSKLNNQYVSLISLSYVDYIY